MPNLRIVLDEWDIQQLLAGHPVGLSGEARPDEIYLGKTGFLKHVRLTQEVGLSSANTNLAGALTVAGIRTSAISAGAGLKLVL